MSDGALEHLFEQAHVVPVNDNFALHLYVNSALKLFSTANKSSSLEQTFVYFLRFVNLALKTIPSHKSMRSHDQEYTTCVPQLRTLREHVKTALCYLELLQVKLREKFKSIAFEDVKLPHDKSSELPIEDMHTSLSEGSGVEVSATIDIENFSETPVGKESVEHITESETEYAPASAVHDVSATKTVPNKASDDNVRFLPSYASASVVDGVSTPVGKESVEHITESETEYASASAVEDVSTTKTVPNKASGDNVRFLPSHDLHRYLAGCRRDSETRLGLNSDIVNIPSRNPTDHRNCTTDELEEISQQDIDDIEWKKDIVQAGLNDRLDEEDRLRRLAAATIRSSDIDAVPGYNEPRLVSPSAPPLSALNLSSGGLSDRDDDVEVAHQRGLRRSPNTDRRNKEATSTTNSHRHTLHREFADFEELAVLGRGSFGCAKKMRDLHTGQMVVVKLIAFRTTEDVRIISNEVRLLRKLDHPAIVSYYNIFTHAEAQPNHTVQTYMGLVMQFCDGGDLAQWISSRVDHHDGSWPVIDLSMAWKLCDSLCDALAYVHGMDILHRDIKPANIFLSYTPVGEIKFLLGDFGLGYQLYCQSRASTQAGTPVYWSPEVMAGEAPAKASDVYAVGCILFEFILGPRHPATGMCFDFEENYFFIIFVHGPPEALFLPSKRADELQQLSDICSQPEYSVLYTLTDAMVRPEPSTRPDFVSLRNWIWSNNDERVEL